MSNYGQGWAVAGFNETDLNHLFKSCTEIHQWGIENVQNAHNTFSNSSMFFLFYSFFDLLYQNILCKCQLIS